MKQSLRFLILVMLLSTIIIGQSKFIPKIDSTIFYMSDKVKVTLLSDSTAMISEMLVQRYQNSQYENYYRALYSYNNDGNQTEYLSQTWNSSAWENSYRMENTYNAQGLVSVSLFQVYAEGAWQNSSKTERTYNTENNPSQMIDSYWTNSAWQPSSKTDYTYDSQQRMVEMVGSNYEYWQSPPNWNYNYKLTNQYNSLSQVEMDYIYYHDGVDWEPSSRASYTYTPTGNHETSYTEQHDSTWLPFSSDSSAYNTYDNLTYSIYKYHNGTVWQDVEQTENIYQSNVLTESIQTSWMYDPYEEWKYRDLFSYNGNNLVSQTSQNWENNQWVNQSLSNMSYDLNNNVSIMEMFSWNGSMWDPSYKYIYTYTNVMDVAEEPAVNDFVLYQNYPNPFNSSTKIVYFLPSPAEVTLILYNTLGEKIKTLDEGMKLAGNHEVILDDNSLSSGVYFYEFTTSNKTFSKKMILLK